MMFPVYFFFAASLAYCPVPGPLLPPPLALNSSIRSNLQGFSNYSWAVDNSFAVLASISGSEVLRIGNVASDHNTTKNPIWDTQTRIASITKVFTVLAILLSREKLGWSDPITDFVPQLNKSAWKHVTVGSLAEQTSGMRKKGHVGDLFYHPDVKSSLGFPDISSDTVPHCDLYPGGEECTPQEILSFFNSPEWLPESPGSGPAYSDIAYNLLGLALAEVHHKRYEEVIKDLIIDPLELRNTGFETPSKNRSIRPNEGDMWWDQAFGNLNPTGGLWSTTSDLLKFEEHILSNTLLAPPLTRAWLKPSSFTYSVLQAVGAPWEILRPAHLRIGFRHPVTLYTKEGDVPGYAAYMILIPEYNASIAISVAGDSYSIANQDLLTSIAERVIDFADEAATKHAAEKYAGVYSDSSTRLEIALDGGPGLAISSWTWSGQNIRAALARLARIPMDTFSIRLYPTDPDASSRTQEKWRLSFDAVDEKESFANITCASWVRVDDFQYAQQRLDSLSFEMNQGGVIGLRLPAWRAWLNKSSEQATTSSAGMIT